MGVAVTAIVIYVAGIPFGAWLAARNRREKSGVSAGTAIVDAQAAADRHRRVALLLGSCPPRRTELVASLWPFPTMRGL